IDVMLVLLVIFMITAPLLTEGVSVDLPQANAKPVDDQSEAPVVLTVDSSGAYYLNVGGDPENALDPPTVVARVAAVLLDRPKAAVMVRGDRNVEYGKVMAAMVLLQAAGAEKVGMVTESPPQER
ncbi:MAG: ExbD/TolR family protein, partial [Chromatiales bacterium]|nr:ExbD/TolR family protein [Chromatiales bacterium]